MTRLLVIVSLMFAALSGIGIGESAALSEETFRLRIFLDGRWLADEARVQAMIGDRDCTRLAYPVKPPSDGPDTPPTYAVTLLTAAETPGCGEPGESIVWLVNGRAADQTTAWPTVSPRPYGPVIDIFVGARPMALEGLVLRATGLTQPVSVEAFINGMRCATGVFRAASPAMGGGDSYLALVVPPAEVEPGCGREGAEVGILIDGRAIEGQTVVWQAGAINLDVILTEPAPPSSLSETYKRRRLVGVVFAAALAIYTVALLLRKVRQPRS